MSDHVKQLDANDFDRTVLESDRPVMVDFYADWCQPCRMLGPTIDALADQFAGRALVAKVNTESSPDLAATYGVQSIPTVLVFKGGEVVEKFIGLQPRDDLAAALDRAAA